MPLLAATSPFIRRAANAARRFLFGELDDFGGAGPFGVGASGYDAINPQNKRKPPTGLLRSEDAELNDYQRRLLISGERDIVRNYTVARWMVSRHLDYVCTFSFQCTTPNKALNKKIEGLVENWSKRENFDVAGRHNRRRAIRLAEARRTVDGDILVARQSDGRTQWIEGDRIRAGIGIADIFDVTKIVHGVKINKAGRAEAYAISRRGRTGLGSDATFIFEKMIRAENAFLHGYFDRFDQVRGISPLASALNELRDTYESFDYARARMKVEQLFGLVFTRGKDNDLDGVEPPASSSSDGSGYEVDFGRGPIKLDLDPGDDAKFLKSDAPGGSFDKFSERLIQIALKALDIPYSFFAENYTNYSGARQALLQYDRSAETKRQDNRDMLDWLTAWRMQLFALDGELPGVDPAELSWQWIATGMPWIDPLKEVLGDVQAIGAGLNTRTRILRERGLEFEDVVAELAHEAKLLRDAGLPLNLDQSNALIHALTKEEPAPVAA